MKDAAYLTHYHRVGTCLWMEVRAMIESLVVSSMLGEPPFGGSPLSTYQVESLWYFLDEMEVGYVHPRSSSARICLSRRRRDAARVTPANPLTKKNLSAHV